MKVRSSVRHHVNVISVRHQMVMRCGVGDVLWPESCLWNKLLLWHELLLRDIGLLWNVVGDVRLMNHVILKVRLVSRMRYRM